MLQRLAKLGGVRCFTPAYRLSPKHIFPAALLDSLAAYLYLLSSPPGAHHQAVAATNIILVGESVGCALMFALTKVLLTARELGITSVQYHGASVQLDLPAAITAFGPYCDFTASLPSERLNIDKDVFLQTLLNPINDPKTDDPTVNWPSDPPRHDYYCVQGAIDHPLVNPIAITNWTGAPPMWFCVGGHERPLDSGKVVAQRAFQSGVAVQFEVYEEMPHIWFALMPAILSTKKCYDSWATAVQAILRGKFSSHAVSFNPWTNEETRQDLNKLVSFPLDHVAKFLYAEKVNRRPIRVRPRNRL
jgi:acetyl esterase/lipase